MFFWNKHLPPNYIQELCLFILTSWARGVLVFTHWQAGFGEGSFLAWGRVFNWGPEGANEPFLAQRLNAASETDGGHFGDRRLTEVQVGTGENWVCDIVNF